MALTPIPTQVPDKKDAVLWSLLNRLETIDESASSRMAHASTILWNGHYMTDRPLFEDELTQIREALNIKAPEATQGNTSPILEERTIEMPTLEVTLRDDI